METPQRERLTPSGTLIVEVNEEEQRIDLMKDEMRNQELRDRLRFRRFEMAQERFNTHSTERYNALKEERKSTMSHMCVDLNGLKEEDKLHVNRLEKQYPDFVRFINREKVPRSDAFKEDDELFYQLTEGRHLGIKNKIKEIEEEKEKGVTTIWTKDDFSPPSCLLKLEKLQIMDGEATRFIKKQKIN